MPLISGARVGPFAIVSRLGAGAMGEVYLARDGRLDRDVALKVLPDTLAADADRVARFQREAKTLASLNHPNIGGIYGIEEAPGVTAIIMELVEGEDLSTRLARGPLALAEALPIARQIANALEAAHEHGIIHRDLKPANIKVRPDGTVKVLDFGLAKSMDAIAGRELEQSPVITSSAMTHAGVILGTAAYMSPEQARGNPLDTRSDIWAFGCVLHEMLTGQRAFGGHDISEVIASVLAREPDLTALPASTPPSIRRLIRRCLQKDRTDRLRDIGDARLEIADAIAPGDTGAGVPTSSAPARRSHERLAWIGVATALAVALIASWVFGLRSDPPGREARVDITTPSTSMPQSMAISPDGRSLAYVATVDGQSQLWLRALETGSVRALIGTNGAESPFWSPDSKSIGFFADGKVRRITVADGAVQIITNATSGVGGTWNQADVILFGTLGDPIARVPAGGGERVAVERLAKLGSDFAPHFLPDGRHFLYYVRGNPEVHGVYVGDLDGATETRRLVASDTGAIYAPSGHLLFVTNETLFAQIFDPARLALSGSPFPVAEGVASRSWEPPVSVSRDGSIVYRVSSPPARRQFVWFSRAGKEISRIGDAVSTALADPMLSQDGQGVVFYRGKDGNTDVWTIETGRGIMGRVTQDAADDVYPVWSPDRDRIVFSSNRTGTHDLYVKKPVTSNGSESLLLASPQPKVATDWSSDGRMLIFNTRDPKTGFDIWYLPMDGTRTPVPVAQTPFDEQGAQFSPDGRWVAFESNESGHRDVYIQRFPGPGAATRVSVNGGTHPRWSRDGKELFYLAPNGQLTAVSIRTTPDAAVPDIGAAAALFAPPIGGALQQGDNRSQYMVSADGQRILVPAVMEGPTPPIRIIFNWKPRP